MRKILFSLVSLSLPLVLSAATQVQEKMINNLDTIKAVFEAQYAPGNLKAQRFGWNLEHEVEKAKAAVYANENITNKDYHKILSSFFGSMQDYHCGVYFYSTENASLPFSVKSIDDKFVITKIYKDRLSAKIYPIEIGDELIAFDGRHPSEVTRELLEKELNHANLETDQAFADLFLTIRAGMLGMNVPNGPISITVRSAETGKVKTYQLIWDYYPEEVKNGSFPQIAAINDAAKKSHFTQAKIASPYLEVVNSLVCTDADEESEQDPKIAQGRSFIPEMGEIVWQTPDSNPLYAYIYQLDGAQIGYVRIPSYILEDETIKELQTILKILEEKTDALVVDEVDNFGGYLFEVYSIVSMLTDKPLSTPKHRLMITQEDVFEALADIDQLSHVHSDSEAEAFFGEEVFGYPVTYQFARFALDFSRFIVEEWNAGRKFTNPTYLSGVDQINPHPYINYTKPLLVLVNEGDFSGGDFFAAILQDNKRATIFGNRTAGAGGGVRVVAFPNRLGVVGFSLTTSVAERQDLQPIENLGVTPDIAYKLTEQDVVSGFKGYVEAANAAVRNLLAPEVLNRPKPQEEVPAEQLAPVQESTRSIAQLLTT